MNYFNSLFNQSRDLFLALTPQARLMAILMAAVVCVSAGFLVRGTTTTAKEKLFNGYLFSDQELKNAQIALSAAKLSDWDTNGNQLLVPKALRDVYLKALGEGKAFPSDLGSWTEKAFENGGIFDGNAKNQARMLFARQKNIGDAIARLPSVEYAWVNYDEQREGFARDVKKVASVFVMPSSSQPISAQLKRDISRLVQASFAGLRFEDISLMDLSNGSSMIGAQDPSTSDHFQYIEAKKTHESELRNKAINMLSDYATATGEVKVEVTAELDNTLREARDSVKLDKPTTVQTQTSTKSIDSTKAGNGGRPGVAAMEGGAMKGANLTSSDGSTNKTKEITEGARMLTGKDHLLTETAGLTLKNATFAVKIPKSYFLKLYKENNPDKKDEKIPDADLLAIENQVKSQVQETLGALLPPVQLVDKGAKKSDRVSVTSYLDPPIPEIAKPTLAETGMAWLSGSWQTLALLGVALFAILVLRSAVVTQPKAKDEEFSRGFGVQIDETMVGGDISGLMKEDSDSEEGESTASEDSPTRRFNMTGETVRDELTQIVRDNPSAAVNIIRNWIGDAA